MVVLNKLKGELMKQNKGIEELAEWLKIEYSSASRKLNGVTRFTPEELAIIADKLNLSDKEARQMLLARKED